MRESEWQAPVDDDALARVLRPIVEGQVRSFINDHPVILESVTWFKRREDKTTTLVNSIAKRIMTNLLCPETRVRLILALGGICNCRCHDGQPCKYPVELSSAGVENATAPADPPC